MRHLISLNNLILKWKYSRHLYSYIYTAYLPGATGAGRRITLGLGRTLSIFCLLKLNQSLRRKQHAGIHDGAQVDGHPGAQAVDIGGGGGGGGGTGAGGTGM